jgi:outer membrane PBP1 activator LpoA protein
MSAIFLAAQEEQAALIRPQLRFHHAIDVPIFASSSVYNPGQPPNNDLDGIRFADMPWSIARDGEARNARQRVSELWPELFNQHGRLFALGFDAYRLVPILMNFEDPLQPPLAAMTGVLSLSENRRIERELGWARFRNGQPVPLEPIEEDDERTSELEETAADPDADPAQSPDRE